MTGLQMNGLLVGLLTAVPVLLGAWLGSHRGGGRTSAWLSKLALAWGSGIALAAYGLRQNWHTPWGLITPIAVGLLVAIFLRMVLAWRSTRPKRRASLGVFQRTAGAVLGSCMGFVLAVAGWQIALLVSSLAAPPPVTGTALAAQPPPATDAANSNVKTAWASLAEVAHHGFIQHLPVAGPLTDDFLAVATILKTPQSVRKQFAQHKQWTSLADLPSFQAIAQDEALFADIDAAVAGNFAALYRLQRHPLIIEFYHEETLQALMANLQASQIAAEMKAFQNQPPSTEH